MTICKAIAALGLISALGAAFTAPAQAQACTRQGVDVTCVIIGNKSSVHVGPGVFVGQGKGMVPMDDPNAPNKRQCAILDGVSYCY
jgi:hypothetical protein